MTRQRLKLPAALDSIPAFHEMVRAAVGDIAPGVDTGMLEMALEELLVNVASYAYPDGEGLVELACTASDGGLDMVLTDHGVAYDPTETPEPDLDLDVEERAIGGLGVFLAGRIFASMSYKREKNANILSLRYVPAPLGALLTEDE